MKSFFKELWLGIKTYKNALLFIVENKLWLYFIFPALLSFLIWIGAYLLEQKLASTEFNEVSTLRELLGELIRNLFYTSLILMGYKLRKYLVFIVLSPLLSSLSLRTEQIVTGNTYRVSWEQYRKDIVRAIRIATGNFIIEYSIFAAWYILCLFLPEIKWITPAFLFLVGCYFYGFCLLDYINERRRLSINESVKFIREHAGLSYGIGLVFSTLFFIPYDIGVLFAPVLGIIAATLAMHLTVDLTKNTNAISPNQ